MLALAEASAAMGAWDIDLTTGLLRGTAQFFRIMGLAPTTEPVPIETTRCLRHPDDRDRVLHDFNAALSSGADYIEAEYRIIRPDGELRWIVGRGRVIRDAAGTPVRHSGIDVDITGRKLAEAALRDSEAAVSPRVRTKPARQGDGRARLPFPRRQSGAVCHARLHRGRTDRAQLPGHRASG